MAINANTPRIYYRELLYEYIKNNDVDNVKNVLNDIVEININVFTYVNNALLSAIEHNNLEIAKLLIECYGANRYANEQMVNFYLKQKADSRLKSYFGFDVNPID